MGNELDLLAIGNCMLQKSEQNNQLRQDYSTVEEYTVDVSLRSWDMDGINAVLDPIITRRHHFTVKPSMINPAPPGL
jgi:hypothetical protein